MSESSFIAFVAKKLDPRLAADPTARMFGVHAEIGGARAVDLGAQFGLVELERDAGVLRPSGQCGNWRIE
jgi:hypothetical protein